MESNLKNRLPQEGTGCLTVRESLGELSGSSCPSYSGEGKDRFRHGVPRNRKTKRLSEIPESTRSSITNSPSSESSSSEGRIASEVKVSEAVLEEKVLALEANRHIMRHMEDQLSSTLQEHVLDGVLIVEKIAALTVKPQDRGILENATLQIKNMLVKTMNNEAKRIVARSQLLLLRRELVEKKEIVHRSQGSKCTNSSRSKPVSMENNNVTMVKNLTPAQCSDITNENPGEQERQQLRVDYELEKMVQTLRIKKIDLGKLKDQSSTALHKYMLDSVAIIKKVAIVIEDRKDQLTLENAAFNVKQAVEGLLKLSDPMVEIHIENNVSDKGPTKQPECSTLSTPDVDQIKQLGGDKLTSFLRKYLENTIDEYLNACEHRFLNEWKVQNNNNITPSHNGHADTKTHKGMKRKIESRVLSPVPEPVYDVWYEMDQFKDFALNRIERDATNKASRKWFSQPDKDAESDAPTNKDSGQDAVRLVRQQPLWWSAELAELKSVCVAARRQYSRSRRRRQRDEAAEMELYADYRSLKKALNAAIKRAKSEQQQEHSGYSESSQES